MCHTRLSHLGSRKRPAGHAGITGARIQRKRPGPRNRKHNPQREATGSTERGQESRTTPGSRRPRFRGPGRPRGTGGPGNAPENCPRLKAQRRGGALETLERERPQTRRETTGSQAQVGGRLRSVAAPTKPPAAADYSEPGAGLGPHDTSHCMRPGRLHAPARQPAAPKHPARQSPNTPAKRASTGTHLRLDADGGRGAEAGEHAQCGVDRAWPASMRSVGRAGLASMRSMGQGGAGKQARGEPARRRALLRQRRAGGRGVARGNPGIHPWVPVFPAQSRHGEALGRGRKEGRPARGSVDSLWPPPRRAGDGRSCEARSGPVAARSLLGGLGVLVGFHSSS